MATDREYREALIDLVNSIEIEIGLEEEDSVLLLHLLDNKEKISKFNRWIQSRLRGETLQATAVEICRAAVQASKGMNPAV